MRHAVKAGFFGTTDYKITVCEGRGGVDRGGLHLLIHLPVVPLKGPAVYGFSECQSFKVVLFFCGFQTFLPLQFNII